ncbi:MAG: hypothetical protein Q6373_014810 [Candidatus Sigynarchaeota archaeon]
MTNEKTGKSRTCKTATRAGDPVNDDAQGLDGAVFTAEGEEQKKETR